MRYYGLAVDSGYVYIVTELMRGGDLRAILDRSDELQTVLRLRIARDVASAIDYMHNNEIVHRDIKTENILLDDGWRPVLGDYGFARKVSSTRAMTICGTDEFMAPEVIWGDPYDERADVFSFGVVMVELFTGRRPGVDGFMERLPRNKFQLDLEQVTQAVAEHMPEAPERLLDLIGQCLAYDADDRVNSSDAVMILNDVLEEYASSHPDDAAAADGSRSRKPSVICAGPKRGEA